MWGAKEKEKNMDDLVCNRDVYDKCRARRHPLVPAIYNSKLPLASKPLFPLPFSPNNNNDARAVPEFPRGGNAQNLCQPSS